MKAIFYERIALISATAGLLICINGILTQDVTGTGGILFVAFGIVLGVISSCKN